MGKLKYSSNVIEKVSVYNNNIQCLDLNSQLLNSFVFKGLLSATNAIEELICDKNGNYLVQKAIANSKGDQRFLKQKA